YLFAERPAPACCESLPRFVCGRDRGRCGRRHERVVDARVDRAGGKRAKDLEGLGREALLGDLGDRPVVMTEPAVHPAKRGQSQCPSMQPSTTWLVRSVIPATGTRTDGRSSTAARNQV